jgi:integrase/recombinase XerD
MALIRGVIIRSVLKTHAGVTSPPVISAGKSHLPQPLDAARLDTWDRAVAAFVATRKSEHTRRAYGRHLEAAGPIMGIGGSGELTGEVLAHYVAAVRDAYADKPASQDQAIAAMRSFLRWGFGVGLHQMPRDRYGVILESSGAEVRRPYAVLTDPEIRRLTASADSARDRALIAVMVGAGLRVSETVNLEVRHVLTDQAGGAAIYVHLGKGRKDRTVPVKPDVLEAVVEYLAATERHLGDRGLLFRAHDRASAHRRRLPGMSESAVWQVIHEAAERSGLDRAKKISPHSLRHTFAVRFAQLSRNAPALQRVLGHASLVTTQRYLDHLDLAEIREMMPDLPTAGRRKEKP